MRSWPSAISLTLSPMAGRGLCLAGLTEKPRQVGPGGVAAAHLPAELHGNAVSLAARRAALFVSVDFRDTAVAVLVATARALRRRWWGWRRLLHRKRQRGGVSRRGVRDATLIESRLGPATGKPRRDADRRSDGQGQEGHRQ